MGVEVITYCYLSCPWALTELSRVVLIWVSFTQFQSDDGWGCSLVKARLG